MEVNKIRTADDVEMYIEGCLNDFEEGISEKDETVVNLAELVAHVYVKATEKPCIEDIPVRKFKKGDVVLIKDGVSSIAEKMKIGYLKQRHTGTTLFNYPFG